MSLSNSFNSEINWPNRAVVTAGMPYGNKALHFGHIAGVFVPADCYARFLRDRIGSDNVLFVSGTDCYGSPIQEGYRKACADNGFEGTILDYVQSNHDLQKATLDKYDISLDIYEGSALGRAAEIHQDMTNRVFNRLHENGHLELRSTLQYFDPEAEVFLNGRQVVGHCPVQGCKSEKAYADECDLGHQFDPAELIAPISTISGKTPEMRPVDNWYFDLPNYRAKLTELNNQTKSDENIRPVVSKTVQEFLGAPVIYIKNELMDDYLALKKDLPEHVFHEAEGNKQSFTIEFDHIDNRDKARDLLLGAGMKLRTGKTLTPFRLSGNVDWGVAIPEIDGVTNLTAWVWPESLWAPISFTKAALESKLSDTSDAAVAELIDAQTKEYWCSKDAQVYQFIGQDNLYFYGIAQPALWMALQADGANAVDPAQGQLQQTKLVANHHILFGKTKASSSGAIKPPNGDELLEHYTVEQLRAHWLALGLGIKSVGFKPKPFVATPEQLKDNRISDPVLKEGALLTNVFNRLARSCMYEAKKNFDCKIPVNAPSQEAKTIAFDTLKKYDEIMARTELHSIMALMDDSIRAANKLWAAGIKEADQNNDQAKREQVLTDASYLLWIMSLLMHPIVPKGCETICEQLQFEPTSFFSWNHDFSSLKELCDEEEAKQGLHSVAELPPRFDFFSKHESQSK